MVSPSAIVATFGEEHVFTCSSLGGPANTYEWIKDGVYLSGETSSELVVSDVTASDGGIYTCTVSNAAGNGSDSGSLYVNLMVTIQPVDTTAVNGSRAEFRFVAESFPLPSYSWQFLDGTSIEGGFGLNTSTLVLDPVTFSSSGDYRCSATANNNTVDSMIARLTGKCVINCIIYAGLTILQYQRKEVWQ